MNRFRGGAAAAAFALAVGVIWPAPPGVLAHGAVIGGLTALISFGIALVYRTNRVVNFAQGDIGAVPAVLSVLLIAGPELPYFAALAVGIATAVALGAGLEAVVIRRFFRAPRLILTVATLGLSQVLAFVALVLPNLGIFELNVPPQSYPAPFDWSITIDPLTFGGNHVIAMLAVPLVIVALAAFFRFTDVGVAVRAIADSTDRAFLVGIPVKRLQTVVWILASVLATIAVFLRAGIVGLPIGEVLGPAILLRALAACVIGRMESLTVIFLAAVGLGVVEQAIVWDTARPILVAPILFAVVLAALLLQRVEPARRGEERSNWTAVTNLRRTPASLARLPEVRFVYGGLALGGLAALLAVPHLVSVSRLSLVGFILIFAIVGISLVVLTGWAGQVSLGQMAFVGIGAAVAGSATARLELDIVVALLLAGVCGALAAVVIGVPALRMRGLFLAVTTMAFALAASEFFLNREFFGGWLPPGRVERPPLLGAVDIASEFAYYHVVVAGFLLAIAAAHGVRQSRTGRLLIAVRENPAAAAAFGVNLVRAKLTAFAISGFLAAFAGGLLVHHQESLGSSVYAPEQSLTAFTMVVVGGMGSVAGAVIGALYIRGVAWFIPGAGGFLAGGIGLLLVLWAAPGGLSWLLFELRDRFLRWVAARRNLIVPSLVADAVDPAVLSRRSRILAAKGSPAAASIATTAQSGPASAAGAANA